MDAMMVAGHRVPAGDLSGVAARTLRETLARSAAEADDKLSKALSRHGDTPLLTVGPSAETAIRSVAETVDAIRRNLSVGMAMVFVGAFVTELSVAILLYSAAERGKVMSIPDMVMIGAVISALPLGLLAFVAHEAWQARKGLVTHFRGPAPVDFLAGVSTSRLVAGRERLYGLAADPKAGAALRPVHYEAVGECSHERGDVVLADRFGVELARVPGVSEMQARAFVDHVRARIPRH